MDHGSVEFVMLFVNNQDERGLKMSKKNSGSSDRSAGTAKSGKRHGHVTYPPTMASAERQAARAQGEQQFLSPRQLTAEREKTEIVFDKALKGFVYRTKKVTIPTDSVFDVNRGRLINSPRFNEKS
jgi:hypothetical protein